ncbi:MAG: hypothetical protein K9G61_06255 [Bacteroidales bacterium]|nr:hypothetical protein [Bacteroidales bacterium]
MKDDFNHIDTFFKAKFDGYEEKAGSHVWDNLRWTLFWMRYKWYISFSSILILGGIFAFVSINRMPPNHSPSAAFSAEQLNNAQWLVYNQTVETQTFTAQEAVYVSRATELDVSNLVPEITREQAPSNGFNYAASVSSPTAFPDVSETHVGQQEFYLSGLKPRLTSYLHANIPDSAFFGHNAMTLKKPVRVKTGAFSVSAYAGPSYATAFMSGASSEYILFRETHEVERPGITIGADFKWQLKNWTFTTGINYSEYNQNRSYSHNYQEYNPEHSYFEVDTSWVWVYDAPNHGMPVISDIDSTWIKVYDTKTVDNSGRNQLRYIEIPLMLGYMFHEGRFSVEVNAGASMGILLYSNMKLPDINNYQQVNEVTELNTTMLNAVAGTTVYFHLNRNTSIFAAPYYKQNLQSVFRNNYDQKQQFNTLGINFGVNFTF